jgi:hypothetical protein
LNHDFKSSFDSFQPNSLFLSKGLWLNSISLFVEDLDCIVEMLT